MNIPKICPTLPWTWVILVCDETGHFKDVVDGTSYFLNTPLDRCWQDGDWGQYNIETKELRRAKQLNEFFRKETA